MILRSGQNINHACSREIHPDYESWIGYLISANLVRIDDNKYGHTPLGRKFINEYVPHGELNNKVL
jgi:hypothetical protein